MPLDDALLCYLLPHSVIERMFWIQEVSDDASFWVFVGRDSRNAFGFFDVGNELCRVGQSPDTGWRAAIFTGGYEQKTERADATRHSVKKISYRS